MVNENGPVLLVITGQQCELSQQTIPVIVTANWRPIYLNKDDFLTVITNRSTLEQSNDLERTCGECK